MNPGGHLHSSHIHFSHVLCRHVICVCVTQLAEVVSGDITIALVSSGALLPVTQSLGYGVFLFSI